MLRQIKIGQLPPPPIGFFLGQNYVDHRRYDCGPQPFDAVHDIARESCVEPFLFDGVQQVIDQVLDALVDGAPLRHAQVFDLFDRLGHVRFGDIGDLGCDKGRLIVFQ